MSIQRTMAETVWNLRSTKTLQKQAMQHGEPTPLYQKNDQRPYKKRKEPKPHLDTLLILQFPLERPENCIKLQIHHRIRTPSEDPILCERPIPVGRPFSSGVV